MFFRVRLALTNQDLSVSLRLLKDEDEKGCVIDTRTAWRKHGHRKPLLNKEIKNWFPKTSENAAIPVESTMFLWPRSQEAPEPESWDLPAGVLGPASLSLGPVEQYEDLNPPPCKDNHREFM